jgi:cysteine synthase
MKDRMALAMIEGAEHDGLLSAGDTVVEYTGGSTGPAIALVCKAKGYRALIMIADCFTEERFQLMRALGAEIDVVRSVEVSARSSSRRRRSICSTGRVRAATLDQPSRMSGGCELVCPANPLPAPLPVTEFGSKCISGQQ